MSAAPFDRLTSIAAPLVRDNVDTDAIRVWDSPSNPAREISSSSASPVST